MQEYVCLKYGISREELLEGAAQFSKLAAGRFAGEIDALCAILDLMRNGDIPAPKLKLDEKK